MSAEAKAVRFRASRVAWGIAAAIVLVMLAAYIISMYGSMNHSMSGDTVTSQGPVTPSVTAPVAEGQMVMSDGSVMDMGEHPVESTATTMAEADHAAVPSVTADHDMDMGGAVNWYVIGGILALIAVLVAVVAGVKERLARDIAKGTLATEGVSGE